MCGYVYLFILFLAMMSAFAVHVLFNEVHRAGWSLPPCSCLPARPPSPPVPQGLFSCTASPIQQLCLALAIENLLIYSEAVNSSLT